MLIFAALEDAIIARIKAASDSNVLRYRFADITSYGGEFDEEVFFTQVRKFPAAWVTVGGAKPKKMLGPRKTLYTAQIAVMVGARNVRGERNTRHGDIKDPGSYQLLDDVFRLLSGQSFGLDLSPLRPGAGRTLFNTRNAREARSVLAAEFSTEFVFGIEDPDTAADLPDMTSIGLHYYLKPGDDVEDANDIVELA